MRTLVMVMVVAAGLAHADPVELHDGEPVGYFAMLKGDVVVVVKHEDGFRLVDSPLGDTYKPSELTFLSDPKGEIAFNVRRIKASYRGKEGWQALRWGMTKSEAQKAAKGRQIAPRKDELEGLAWQTTVAERPARVGGIFANGRLVAIEVTVLGVDEEPFWDLLSKKYGADAQETDEGARRWRLSEGTVVASWSMVAGTVRYTSKVFAVEAMAEIQKKRQEQSQDL